MQRNTHILASVAAFALCAVRAFAGSLPAQAHEEPPNEVYYADAYADHYEVPRPLVHAIIRAESSWHPRAVSNKGARGLMQLMPKTASQYGVVNPFSVSENISGGVQYLADLMREFGDLRLVVAAYYVGAHPMHQRGLKYSNSDVTNYVQIVRRYYAEELERHQSDTQLP